MTRMGISTILLHIKVKLRIHTTRRAINTMRQPTSTTRQPTNTTRQPTNNNITMLTRAVTAVILQVDISDNLTLVLGLSMYYI